MGKFTEIAWTPQENLEKSTDNCMDSLEKAGNIQQKMHGFPRKTWKIHRELHGFPRKTWEIQQKMHGFPRKTWKIHRELHGFPQEIERGS